MPVIEVDPCNDPQWKQLASSHRFASVFHSPAWLQVIRDTYGFEVKAALSLDSEGQPIAGLPYSELNDSLGRRCIIFPFSDYCDPLVSNAAEWVEVTSQLNLDEFTKVRTLNNPLPMDDDRFDLIWKAKWHGLEIGADLEDLKVAIDGSARRGINKSFREGVRVSLITSVSDLRSFFHLHLQIRKGKYRLLAQPYAFFENIWHLIIKPGRGAILKAEYRGEMIGAALFLNWGEITYYKISASDTQHKSLRTNEALIWEGIKYAKSQGSSFLDLGLSDWDQQGLIGFKRKFASEESTIHQLAGTHPLHSSSSRQNLIRTILPRLTDFFTAPMMPDSISEKAGNILYRYFA